MAKYGALSQSITEPMSLLDDSPSFAAVMAKEPVADRRIIVSGYPRSGTHWLFWMLADVLECPALGYHEFECRNTEQKSDYTVLHHHLLSVRPAGVEARAVILMVRDPRDVAVSVLNYYEGARGIDYVDRWSEYNGRWLEYATAWIRYEDLIASPVKQLNEILKATRVGVSPERILSVVENHSFAVASKRYDAISAWKPDKMYNRGIAGAWCERLSPEQACHITDRHSEMMVRLGYDLD